MRILTAIAEAYRQPLHELASLTHTPVHGTQVTCPFTSVTNELSNCVSCPLYVRTQVFEIAGGQWSQTVVACDAARLSPTTRPPGASTN
jgi:hypothetical protein